MNHRERRRARRADKASGSTDGTWPASERDDHSVTEMPIPTAGSRGTTPPAAAITPRDPGDSEPAQIDRREQVAQRPTAAAVTVKTVLIAVGGGKEKVEVPDTGDDLYDEAVAFLKFAGTTNLAMRGHIDRVCEIIGRRFVAPDIGADPQKWRQWERNRGIKVAKNVRSMFQPVLKAMAGKNADTSGFISQAAYALTEWADIYREPELSNDPDRLTPARVEADEVAAWMAKSGGYAGVYKLRRERLRKLNPAPTKERRREAFRMLIDDCLPLHRFVGLSDALRDYDGLYCALIQIVPHADALTLIAPGEHPGQAWIERNAARLIASLPTSFRPGHGDVPDTEQAADEPAEDGAAMPERTVAAQVTEAAPWSERADY